MSRHLRTVAYTAYLSVALVVMGIACMPVMLFGRSLTRKTVQAWSRLALFGLKTIGGISYKIEGLENLPTGGALIASNHQSMWETIALYALAPKPAMIFKKELLRIPIYGWYAIRAGNICVDRKGGAKALRAMAREARERAEAGEQIIIFPEGTRTKPGIDAEYKPGIALLYKELEIECLPVALNTGTCWPAKGIIRYPGTMVVEFLPRIQPGLSRKAFMKTLHDRIETRSLALAEDAGVNVSTTESAEAANA